MSAVVIYNNRLILADRAYTRKNLGWSLFAKRLTEEADCVTSCKWILLEEVIETDPAKQLAGDHVCNQA